MSSATIQKRATSKNKQGTSVQATRLLVSPSTLGWIAVLSGSQEIHRLTFGYASKAELLEACATWQAELTRPNAEERSWLETLQQYAAGQAVDLSKLPIRIPAGTPFQTQVLKICRSIPAGTVMTYSQIAERAGAPGAARAVGTVMSRNRLPLVIPCHRVVGKTGLGGFSAPDGLDMKRRLLQMELNQAETRVLRGKKIGVRKK